MKTNKIIISAFLMILITFIVFISYIVTGTKDAAKFKIWGEYLEASVDDGLLVIKHKDYTIARIDVSYKGAGIIVTSRSGDHFTVSQDYNHKNFDYFNLESTAMYDNGNIEFLGINYYGNGMIKAAMFSELSSPKLKFTRVITYDKKGNILAEINDENGLSDEQMETALSSTHETTQ